VMVVRGAYKNDVCNGDVIMYTLARVLRGFPLEQS
jgi:hypothetical protein